MKKFIVFIVLLLAACTHETRSKNALYGTGFKDANFSGGYDFIFSPCNGEFYQTEFEATKADNNERVSGTVCCSMFSTCSVKF